MPRFFTSARNWIRSVPARINGSHVEIRASYGVELSPRAEFPADPELEFRRDMASDTLRNAGVTVKRLIESQPDTFVKPAAVDYEQGLPIG